MRYKELFLFKISLLLTMVLWPVLVFAQSDAIDMTDSDGDGMLDFEEANWGTDPKNSDTDKDGYYDKLEVINGYDPLKPAPAILPKWIKIDLSDQKLSYGQGPKVFNEFLTSTGKSGYKTPTGEFSVLNKIPLAWSKTYGLYMPYWMSFTANGHGIHELPYWPGGFREGATHLGKPVSHGCVRLGIGPAKDLYDWAEIGTRVKVID
ncbi:MAG: L,D-transpeptidase family protein [Patescibacteria group bacterium]